MRNPLRQQHQNHDFNTERFKTRLTAKSCVILVAITQIITRVIIITCENNSNRKTALPTIISLPFYAAMALVVCFEYYLYRKIGPKIMNYSQIIDIILLLFFTVEWLLTIWAPFNQIIGTDLHVLPVTTVFIFTGFQWRTLFLLFLVQSWKLLVIPPTLALSMTIGFTLHFALTAPIFILLRGVLQVIYMIIMIYFLDKIKWKEILTNSQQERWIQINDFVLNNIPENIVIIELGGDVTFVNDYCKTFMRKAHLPENPRDLFTNIRELYLQLESEPSSPSTVKILMNNLLHFLNRCQGTLRD